MHYLSDVDATASRNSVPQITSPADDAGGLVVRISEGAAQTQNITQSDLMTAVTTITAAANLGALTTARPVPAIMSVAILRAQKGIPPRSSLLSALRLEICWNVKSSILETRLPHPPPCA